MHREFNLNETKLILPIPSISESYDKVKINLIFFFTLLCGASKGFKKTWNGRKRLKIKLIVFDNLHIPVYSLFFEIFETFDNTLLIATCTVGKPAAPKKLVKS